MNKKKKKNKTGPRNPLADKPIEKLLNVLISEGVSDEYDPVMEVLLERKQEAVAKITEQLRLMEGVQELSVMSEALALLCEDEIEYNKFLEEVFKADPQKADLMISGYWRLPKITESGWIWERVKKAFSSDERVVYYQLLMDRFLDVQALKESLPYILKKNLSGHVTYYRKSLLHFLTYKGISPMKEEILEMPREEVILLSGAWSEVGKEKAPSKKFGEELIEPLSEEEQLQQQQELLQLGADKSAESRLNVLLFVKRAHPKLNQYILPYLEASSWRVRFEAVYRIFPHQDQQYVDKLWEVFDRKDVYMEEKYAAISVLTTCGLDLVFDRLVQIIRDESQPLAVRFSIPASVILPNREMMEQLKPSALLTKWVEVLREIALDTEQPFLLRFSAASKLSGTYLENFTAGWSGMEKQLYLLGTDVDVAVDVYTKYGLDMVEPLVYLHQVMQENRSESGKEIQVLKNLGPGINEKLLEILKGNDIIAQYSSLRLLTIFPEEKTAEVLLGMLPEVIEKERFMLVRTISQALSHFQQLRVKIGDSLLEILKMDGLDEYVTQCLVTTLCALGQPRVLPVLFERILEGKIYGVAFGQMAAAVGNLCQERPRALEVIEEKMSDDENPLLREFSQQVMQYLIQVREAEMQQQQMQ
ncbi:hypothetical protein [Candidatus Contubernalis alkaliaceticus]|uniref:hypothetical protein n=1 Tax=Candidatus Contubernalis alkaliaceticus TaxID=338645 RepID=UPI001F4BFC49|nr:hypothetical protein [Candidatus Contubernalis alkalaceticus]UNC93440.1 hypothetical protein HUE98_15965 [Candidatus Contubernalis alkalaceticus]